MVGQSNAVVAMRPEKSARVSVAFLVALLLQAVTLAPVQAQQLPTGGAVAAGSATISQPSSNTLNVNQSTTQAIINWQSFSVGAGGTVNFNQPSASSATLNRVLGSTPSTIAGTINAPGTVLLVNPNGIAITKSGVVNVGSFAASTLDIKNEDFLAGSYKFTGAGSSQIVRNSGRINVSDGGFAALLGGQVSNNGVIAARLGKVGLGSGELITLDLAGDGFLSVAVPSNQIGNLRGGDGQALVSNRGKIKADGGAVFLSAATAANILRDAVNVPGSIRANSVGTQNGRIVIGGGAGGKVRVSGNLSAKGNAAANGGQVAISGAAIKVSGKINTSGKNGGTIIATATKDLQVANANLSAAGREGAGGRIDLASANITVLGALIDASGKAGGGLVRIGGTFQGGNGDPNDPLYQFFIGRFGTLTDIASAQTVSIDSASKINVSADLIGDGGTAVVWSDNLTQFAGTIAARGGANGGNGGAVETSGKLILQATGLVEAAGPLGRAGSWLLDPNNITIQSAGTNTNVTGTPNFTSTNDNAIVTVASITTALNAGTSVTVSTASAGTNSQSGNITVATNAAIGWTGNASLTLNATGSIIINSGANITANTSGANGNKTITLIAGTDITTSAILSTTYNGSGNGISLTAGRDIAIGGAVTANSATGTAINVTAARNISITNTISATASGGVLTLTAGNNANPGATVTESGSGRLSVSRLQLLSAATSQANKAIFTLNATNNSVSGQLAGSVGSLSYTTNNAPLLVGFAGSTNGLTANGNITLNVTGGSSNLTIANPISTSGTLTLNVGNKIFAGQSGATVNVGKFSLLAGAWTQILSPLPAFTAGDFSVGSSASFLRATGGDGSSGNPYLIADVYGLQGVAGLWSFTNFKVANPINASGTATWNGGAGFVPIGGGDANTIFQSATFDGNNQAISGLTINRPSTNNVGLFGYNGGTIQNVVLTGVNITGNSAVGALVGNSSDGASVTNSSASGTVNGFSNWVGGLIGLNVGPVANSTANVTVTGADGGVGNIGPWSQAVGGLIGTNTTGSTITNSSSSGNVYGWRDIGGLVGSNAGTITGSFATGTVRSPSQSQEVNVGGLVGSNFATIVDSYATGDVVGFTTEPAPFDRTVNFGGLVGFNLGSIVSSYATGNVTGHWYVGGLVGINGQTGTAGTIQNSYATGIVTAGGWNAGGLVGANQSGSTISNSYATGKVQGTDFVGGLAGYNGGFFDDSIGTITGSWATGNVSGDTRIGGLVGRNHGTSGNGSSVSTSYATGMVSGGDWVGGFVGENWGNIHEAYATGAVTGSNTAIGGFVGYSNGSGANITNAYATGNVTGTGSAYGIGGFAGVSESPISSFYATGAVNAPGYGYAGALIGWNRGGATVTSGYWNSDSNVGMAGIGIDDTGAADVNPKTTAQLKAGLPAGFSSSFWGIIPTVTYPFLLFQPGVVSGTVYSTYGGSVVQNASVTAIINGTAAGFSVLTDASGRYVLLLTGTTSNPAGNQVVAYTTTVNGVSYQHNAAGPGAALDIYGTFLSQITPASNTSTLNAAYTAAIGATVLPTTSNLAISATRSSFVLDTAINTNTLVLSTAGTITQTSSITAGNLLLMGSGATYALTNAGNNVGKLAANVGTGGISLTDTLGLIIDTVAGTAGVTTGTLTLSELTGNITETQKVTATGATSFTTQAAGASIDLSTQTNALAGAVTLNTGVSGGNASLKNGQATALAAAMIGGNLVVVDTIGNLSQTGALAVSGSASFTTQGTGATIALTTNANAFTGAVSFGTTGSGANVTLQNTGVTVLGTSTIGGGLTVTARGTSAGRISQIGALSVAGAASFTAQATATSGATTGIALTNTGNAFTGAVSLNTATGSNANGDANLTNSIATVLGTSSVLRNLAVLDVTGNVSQTGALTVGGTSSFTTQAAGAAVTLATTNNAFTGAVSFNTNGAGANVTLQNTGVTVLGTSTIGGGLTVTARGTSAGRISQIGALSVAGAASFTAQATATSGATTGIALTNTGNAFAGAVSLNTATGSNANGDANLTNSIATVLGTSSVLRNLAVLDVTGNLSQTGAVTVGGTSSFTTQAAGANIDLSTQTNALAGAVTLNTGASGGNARLKNGQATLLNASTAGGTIGVTSSGSLSIAGAINAAVLSLNLASGTTATQTQAINANLELLGSGATYTLSNAANKIGSLAADTGSVTLSNSQTLTIGSVGNTIGFKATTATLATGGAASDVAITAAVNVSGTLTLNGSRNISDTANVSAGTFILLGGAWVQNMAAASLPTFAATDFRVVGGSFLRAVGGDGTVATPYLITDVFGLQGMGKFLALNFALANDIVAGGTAGWNITGGTPAGFVPISNGGSTNFTGSFDGTGHTISGLYVNAGNYTGLFGALKGTGTISNVGLIGGSVNGGVAVGALVGVQNGGTISRVFSTASVNGFSMVGGLVGMQGDGTITQSYSAGNATASHDTAGGLVGYQGGGTISNSYARGTVSAPDIAGGLVGENFYATIINAYATGAVMGTTNLGGLVGTASGAAITSSYWDTQTTGRATSAGGGTGRLTAAMQDFANFQTNYPGWNFQTTWAPPNQAGQAGNAIAHYAELYALTPVVWNQADNKTKTYGDSNPLLTASQYGGVGVYKFGPAGDTLTVTPSLSTTADAGSNVGNYSIDNATPSSALSTGNVAYRVIAGGGVLLTTQRALTVTGGTVDRTYGDNNPATTTAFTAPTGSAGSGRGLVNGDAIGSVTVSSLADNTYAVGAYSFTPGGASFASGSASNYAITYVNGTLNVTQRALTVTGGTFDRTYGDNNPATTTAFTAPTGSAGSATGLVNGDTIGSVAVSSLADNNSNVGGYSFTPGGASFTSGSAGNYAITYVNGTLNVTQRALTVAGGTVDRTYGDNNPATTTAFTAPTGSAGSGAGLVNGDAIGSVTVSSLADNTYAVGAYRFTSGGASFTSGSASNYAITYVNGTLNVTQRALTVTGGTFDRTYGDNNPATTTAFTAPTGSAGSGSGLVNGDMIGSVTVSSLADSNSNVGGYSFTPGGAAFTFGVAANYAIAYVAGTINVTPATLTFTANPASRPATTPNPAFTGLVTGFKNGQTTSTFGGDIWSSPADASSSNGSYAINGTLAFAAPNYTLIQAAGNATALTVGPAPVAPGQTPGVVTPLPPTVTPTPTTISFTPTTPALVSLPLTRSAPQTGNNIVTGSGINTLSGKNGLNFPPISQFDANQYSQFALPGYEKDAGEAAVLTMIARAALPDQAAALFIDTFWNGQLADWGAASDALKGKVTFSDGAGNVVSPGGANGFPIVAGTTNIGEMLGQGPVMIGAADGAWLLAIKMSDDGKSIVANDPATGTQVLLSYDVASKTVGGITATFDTKTNTFVPMASSQSAGGVSSAQSFVASTFLAATIR